MRAVRSAFVRVRTVLAAVTGALIAYVTIFGFVVPRVDVQPLLEIDSTDPYKHVFAVKNSGNLDINDVVYGCRLKGAYMDGRTEPIRIVRDENRWLSMVAFAPSESPERPRIEERTISAAQTDSVTCTWFDEPLDFMLDDGREMAIDVIYRPAYFPWRREKPFGFRLRKTSDGAYRWIPVASERG